ncbi:MAG: RNA-binding protein [Methylacidiphilaceae bacterium]|nr:RNA-binding protein [Candidatus Methylacidiphilaceae bacterium]
MSQDPSTSRNFGRYRGRDQRSRRRGGRERPPAPPRELSFGEKVQAFFLGLFGQRQQLPSPTDRPGAAREREREPRKAASPPAKSGSPMFESVVAPSTPRLYVGNLPYEVAESDLFDFFSKVGSVKNVDIVRDRRTNRSKGYGFVEMADLETAKQAFTQLNRVELVGRQIVVSGAKSERRDGRREASEPSL